MRQAAARKERTSPDRSQTAVRGGEPRTQVTLKQAAPLPYHLVWITTLLLLIGGLCMVLSVSTAEAISGEDKFVYVRPQGIAALFGLAALFLLSRIDYRKLRVPSVVVAAGALLLLLLLHVPGLSHSAGGASSWFELGSLTLQPSEFAKLALVLVGAHLLSSPRVRDRELASFMWPFGAVGVVMCGLVTLEGDLGTAIIVAGLLLGMLWLGGMQEKHWLAIGGLGGIIAMVLVFTKAERMSRVFSFLNPSADATGAGYQLSQSLVALGRGGWLGAGPGESIQKFQYLPKAHTDMIFSILGEEFGVVGTALVILLFAGFALACWQLARRCSDPMGKYLMAGCGMLVTFQAVVNIGGVIGAMPLTGVPLPFISYGRSSLVAMLMAVGLVLAVARRAPARPASAAVRYGNVARIDRRGWNGGARSAGSGAR